VAFDRSIIEARLALDLIHPEEMPKLAQDALEAGWEGQATLRLTILECPSGWETDQLREAFMKECGLKAISLERAWTVMAQQLARRILEDGSDPLSYAKSFQQMWIKAGYPKRLQYLGMLDDDLYIAQYTGQSQAKFRSSVLEDLAELSVADLGASYDADARDAS
jgi:hypothetical protein